MARYDIETARATVAQELFMMKRVLSKYSFCPDLSPLEGAASRCKTGKTLRPDEWGYHLDKLLFKPQTTEHSIPKGIYPITVEFTTEIVSNHWNDSTSADPFQSLEFNVVLRGEHTTQGVTQMHHFSWHLDRDLGGKDIDAEIESETAVNTSPQEFMHPLYHFQCGGKKLWAQVDAGVSFGNALILESPRFAHPPMDAILGIDFILTNFFPHETLDFRSEGEYKNIIVAAQKRCWRPYAHALLSAWDPMPQSCSLRPHEIWPQLPNNDHYSKTQGLNKIKRGVRRKKGSVERT